jgi:hypothetical protein
MKSIEDLTREDWQDALRVLFDNNSIEYSRTILKPDYNIDESCGIEYSVNNELMPLHKQKCMISFSNPELLAWLYENDVDLTLPLQQLKFDFIDLDETNSILFEFVMGVNKIINDFSECHLKPEETVILHEMGPVLAEELNKIKELQKELINKL